MENVLTHSTGEPEDRKKVFKKLWAQAKKYKVDCVDLDLQAMAILNICAEIKLKQFSATLEEMVQVLTLFGKYTPVDTETQLTAALKLCNTLCLNIDEPFFVVTTDRAKELRLKLQTTRKLEQPEIDLSDEEEVPLTAAATFSSHKSVLLDDKDGLREHIPLKERLSALADERSIVRVWGNAATANAAAAATVVLAYANKDVSSLGPQKIQQYLLKSLSHRMKILSEKVETAAVLPAPATAKEVHGSPEKRTRANGAESALAPSESEVPKYHSSGTPLPPPPESGLGEDHPFAGKVVNTHEVQLAKPRVPHPVTHEHAMQCLSLVNEIESLAPSKSDNIHSNITDKLTKWLCPPGFSWHLTFDSNEKRKQALILAKSATEILNMRVRREAQARVMAQNKMDTSAEGMFPFVKFDIEREYQLLTKFRRSLFCIELGERVASEMDKIKRLSEASVNSGIGKTEKMLFEKLLKARLNAIVEVATSPAKKKGASRVLCTYCKKRHPGGAAQCRKKKADAAAEKQKSQKKNRDRLQPQAESGQASSQDLASAPPPKKKPKIKVTAKRPDPKDDT